MRLSKWKQREDQQLENFVEADAPLGTSEERNVKGGSFAEGFVEPVLSNKVVPESKVSDDDDDDDVTILSIDKQKTSNETKETSNKTSNKTKTTEQTLRETREN